MNKVIDYVKFKIEFHAGIKSRDLYEYENVNLIAFAWYVYTIEIIKNGKMYYILFQELEDPTDFEFVVEHKYQIPEKDIYHFVDWLFNQLYPRRMY